MGQSMAYGMGSMVANCGCTNVGFETKARGLITMAGISPWPAKEMILENIRRQEDLAKRTPLRHISVYDGLNHFQDKVGGMFGGMTAEVFQQNAIHLLDIKGIHRTTQETDELLEVFASMDYDENGRLSLGEWAGGLTVFFKGTREDCCHAAFAVLDRDGNRQLDRGELTQYLSPFVNAMTPPEAAALRPLLLQKCSEEIFEGMDIDHDGCITSDEMIQWMKAGNNIIDHLVTTIESEVYRIWLDYQTKHPDHVNKTGNTLHHGYEDGYDYGHGVHSSR